MEMPFLVFGLVMGFVMGLAVGSIAFIPGVV